jgi:beta-hydroxylase
MHELHWIRDALLALLLLAVLHITLRGRVRHSLWRQITDHSTFMAPYNSVMYLSSAVPTTPYVDVELFPELQPLREQWRVIRDEGLQLFHDAHIRAASRYNDLGFNSFFRSGWKRFYLKWYEDFLPSARALCPKTTALLAGIPSVKAAMFAMLPPGARLNRHRDPFAGSLRFHLGLSTPNSPDCRIVVDGEPYFWKDGEAVMFDETYIHYAENRTDMPRLILFCDIDRPLSNPLARFLNRSVGRRLLQASATQNVAGEHVGVFNRIFGWVYRIRLAAKRLKAWNRTTYYALKWLLVGVLLYAIFL